MRFLSFSYESPFDWSFSPRRVQFLGDPYWFWNLFCHKRDKSTNWGVGVLQIGYGALAQVSYDSYWDDDGVITTWNFSLLWISLRYKRLAQYGLPTLHRFKWHVGIGFLYE